MKEALSSIIIITAVLAVGLLLPCGAAFPQSIFGLTTEEEIAVGKNISQDIERALPVYRNPAYQSRLIRVGTRLTYVADRKDVDYTFHIIDKDELNAFATFGGYIYIYKGAMDKAADDDELAAILAHEIGHVSARHLAKAVEKSRAFGLWFGLLDYFVLRKQKHREDIYRVADIGYDLIQRGYTRQDEFEADRLSVRYMHRAGFDPLGAIRVLNKLKKEDVSRFPDPFENIGILRTHPFVNERVDAIVSEIAAIKAEDAYKSGNNN
jgi:predicted Zn-dependent protease